MLDYEHTVFIGGDSAFKVAGLIHGAAYDWLAGFIHDGPMHRLFFLILSMEGKRAHPGEQEYG